MASVHIVSDPRVALKVEPPAIGFAFATVAALIRLVPQENELGTVFGRG